MMEKRNLLWFLLGCGLALILAGVLLYRPLRGLSAESGTATPAAPTAAPTATVVVARPSPTPVVDSLLWERQGGLAGFCDKLTLSDDGQAYFAPCAQGARLAPLNDRERAEWELYRAHYGAFVYTQQDNPGGPDNLTVTLRFAGRGSVAANEAEQAALAAWVEAIYSRLSADVLRAELTSKARLDLATRLGRAVDAVQVESVESVTWPDACLGLAPGGTACAAVATPGLRVVLMANGARYEYRTDLAGMVELANKEQLAAAPATATPMAPPPPTPTQAPAQPTLYPTATPWPTAIPLPTATPVPPQPTRPAIPTDAWLAEYYANTSLSGAPALVRVDKDVNFDWGYGSPAPGLPTDHFSVRWSRRMSLSEGDYNFKVLADDGVRLWVAGNLIIDRWSGGSAENVAKQHVLKGEHLVVLEYFELEGIAKARLRVEKFYAPKPTPSPTSPVITDWKAEYFDNYKLSGSPRLVRNDERIAFAWGGSAPVVGLPSEGFSVRWTRKLAFDPGPYRFLVRSEGAVKLRVGEYTLIDAPAAGLPTTYEGHLWLGAAPQDLRLEYRHQAGNAEVTLTWEKVEQFQGWKGEYYPNRQLSGDPLWVRDDPAIDFNWGAGPVGLGIKDDYAVRWTRVVPLGAGRYRFFAYVDDGLRVYLNGQRIMDDWRDAATRHIERTVDLPTGWHTLVVEYYERSGTAQVAFGWEHLAEATATATATPTTAPSLTPTHTATAVATAMPSLTPTHTATLMPTATPTLTLTVVASPTATLDPSITPTATLTATATPTATLIFLPVPRPTVVPGGGRYKPTDGVVTHLWSRLIGQP